MVCNRSTRLGAALATILLGLVGGCWSYVQDHCPGCAIVSERTPQLPPMDAGTREVIVLVHGAFGFGQEWDAVVAAARRRPHAVVLAFAWGGPWTRKPTLAAEALRQLVQAALDQAPAADVLVIAHSAGGALARYAGERLRVGDGTRQVRILSIAAPRDMNLEPYRPERAVNTPLGLAVGGEQPRRPPIARGVTLVELATEDAPAGASDGPDGDGVRHVWLGRRVGHNESVALAALPYLQP